MTFARYSGILVNYLKTAIGSKRQGLPSNRVLLLHNNPGPHTAAHTVDTLCALEYEVLKHPPYSPDMAQSDFHLFGPLKQHMQGQKFAGNNEIIK
jgi:histone-lysine N-methyltransferase SETMAR